MAERILSPSKGAGAPLRLMTDGGRMTAWMVMDDSYVFGTSPVVEEGPDPAGAVPTAVAGRF